MNKILNKIWNIGIREDQDEYLRNKIKITNQISVALSFTVAFPFSFLSWIYYPDHLILTYLTMFGFFACYVIIFFNYIGATILARLLLSSISMILIILYHGYIVEPGGERIATSSLLQLSFSLIAFIVFDRREWAYIMLMGVINIVGFLSFEYTNEILHLENEDGILFRRGWLGEVLIVCALIVAYSSIYFLVYINSLSQKENQQLIYEADENKKELEASENMLRENIEKLKEAQEEEQKRNWTNEGLAKFGEILRKNDGGLEDLANSVIGELVNYLEFNQGGIFVLEEDEKENQYLNLIACFAYDRKKYLEKQIAVGKGLLGQSILEKSTVLLKKVPEGYMSITSGLGEATPSTVVIVPLMVNESVYGALELASFGDAQEHKVSFVEKLSESIASTISTARINEKTKKLLEDSQMMAEQMKAQEEEMRQNMEELQATQEEMERKHREMESVVSQQRETEESLRLRIKELESQQNK